MHARSTEVTDLVDDYKYEAAIELLRQLVHEGVSVDEIRDTRYTGHPPIWIRLLDDGRDDAARLAIEAGADVNAKSSIGIPVLAIAAGRGFADIVDLLIARGANVNPRSVTHDEPLRAAAKGGHGTIVTALLDAGADVNSTNEFGHTPLMAGAMAGDIAIMDCLIARGAKSDAKDKFGRDVMFYAVSNGNAAAVDYLTRVGAGSARAERLQAIISFSERPMSDWDASLLHREIEESQNKMGRMTDRAVFRAITVVAGDSLADDAYLYTHLRQHLADLGGHDLLSRCLVFDFRASTGNHGKYFVVVDKDVAGSKAAGTA